MSDLIEQRSKPIAGTVQRRYCPVCWQHVLRTSNGNVARHMDSIGSDTCPYSAEPWGGVIQGPRRPRQLASWQRAA